MSILTDDPSYVVMLGLVGLATGIAVTDGAVRVPGVLVRVAIPIWPAVDCASQFLRRIEDEILATILQPFAEQVAVPELRRMAGGPSIRWVPSGDPGGRSQLTLLKLDDQ